MFFLLTPILKGVSYAQYDSSWPNYALNQSFFILPLANFQNGSEDVSKFVKQTIQAIVLALEKLRNEESEFFVSVLSSAFINYHKQYQDLLNEEFFDVVKKQKLAIPIAKMTSLGCDAFFKVHFPYTIIIYGL